MFQFETKLPVKVPSHSLHELTFVAKTEASEQFRQPISIYLDLNGRAVMLEKQIVGNFNVSTGDWLVSLE